MGIEELSRKCRHHPAAHIKMICTAAPATRAGTVGDRRADALYFRLMRIDPKTRWPDRDRFICPRATPARCGMRRWPSAGISTRNTSRPCADWEHHCKGIRNA